jgi:hypothetical protein
MANSRLVRGIIAVAVLLALVILLPELWASFAAGALGGLWAAWSSWRGNARKAAELNLLEPLGFVEGEGGWQVRLDTCRQPEAVKVLHRSLDINVSVAIRTTGTLPTVVLQAATEEHARELVNRLRRAGATAEAIPPTGRAERG